MERVQTLVIQAQTESQMAGSYCFRILLLIPQCIHYKKSLAGINIGSSRSWT